MKRDKFQSSGSDFRQRDGQSFKIVKEVSSENDPDIDEEIGVMYLIEFEDGEVIHAFPEEVYEDE